MGPALSEQAEHDGEPDHGDGAATQGFLFLFDAN
jgi:hypothetical protein